MQEKTLQRDILPHRDRLFRLALSITLHTAEAEDVVQDTMLQAWNHRHEWPQIRDMEAWLCQVCRRLALDRKPRLERMQPLTELPLPTQGITLEQRERIGRLTELMEQLPSPQGDIIRLRDIEGLPYQDIAARLQITEDQVRVYLHRARQRIRQTYLRIESYGL